MPMYQSYYPSNYSQMPINTYQASQPYLPYQNYMNSTPSQAQPTLVGKVVGDFTEIVANDVPMDGRSAIFPKNDLSEIQLKSWGADGKIQTRIYKPITDNFPNDVRDNTLNTQNIEVSLTEALTSSFMQRFDEITSRLDDIDKMMNKNNKVVRTKKESDAE